MPVTVMMPALSPTMEEGVLAKWLVKEGDDVAPGDVLAEIETDKATMEVEAIDEGRIGKILVPDGTEGVAVNTPIAVILVAGESADELKKYTPASSSPEPVLQPEKPQADAVVKEEASPPSSGAGAPVPHQASREKAIPDGEGGRLFASPLARRLAAQHGIDVGSLGGSGPHGRIVKQDVEAAIARGPAVAATTPPAAPGGSLPDARLFYDKADYDSVPLDGMRRAIARRMTQSMSEIPHFYLTVDCKIDKLLEARKSLNQADEDLKLSVNDFLVRAAAMALMKVPDANSSWAGDALLRHHHADVGVAVALDGGLITPIIRRADEKQLGDIAAASKDLIARARARKLKPGEYEGGTFSISNLGMYGIREFTAVINPPQAAILAVGSGEKRAIVEDGAVTIATIMTVTLSCDHRVIDGALGAQLLGAFRQFVEEPLTMLV